MFKRTDGTTDNRTKRGSGDRKRINVHEQHELRYWPEKFGVSRDELRRAVERGELRAAGAILDDAGNMIGSVVFADFPRRCCG
jgi:hypothetical protein